MLEFYIKNKFLKNLFFCVKLTNFITSEALLVYALTSSPAPNLISSIFEVHLK